MAITLIDRLKAYSLDVITITNLESVNDLGYESFNDLIIALKDLEKAKKVRVKVNSVLDNLKEITPIMCCEITEQVDINDFQNEIDNLKAVTIEMI